MDALQFIVSKHFRLSEFIFHKVQCTQSKTILRFLYLIITWVFLVNVIIFSERQIQEDYPR